MPEKEKKEHNNFRSAIDYSLTPGADLKYGCCIGAAVSLFWIERSYFYEGIERLHKLIGQATDPSNQNARAKMLYRAAAIYTRIFDYNTALKLCQQSIDI